MEVYFDNAATTRPLPEVLEEAGRINSEFYGNPSSAHGMGIKAEREIKKATEGLARRMGVMPEEIIFTSGGTESNNLAILGALGVGRRRHVVTTRTEHPSVSKVMKYLSENGYEVSYLEVDRNGQLDFEQLSQALRPETALVSVIHVNNETGVILDIAKIAEIVKTKNPDTLIHVDGVQGFGKDAVNLKGIDLYSASAHKIHGLKGAGFLYVRDGVRLSPVLFGGGQQRDIRPGTENTAGIISLCAAAEICYKNMDTNLEKVRALKKQLLERLETLENIFVVGRQAECSPYILNISFPGVKSEVLLNALGSGNVYVSAGSACNARKKRDGILQSYGLPEEISQGAIRFSFSHENTPEEVDYCAGEVIKNVKMLRRFGGGRK